MNHSSSNQSGSNQSGSNQSGANQSGANESAEDELDEPTLVDCEPEPPRRGNTPLLVMGISLALLLVTLGIVGFLFTRSTSPDGNSPTMAPRTPEPTGVPVLPVKAGDFSREPGSAPSPVPGVDQSIHTASAVFTKDGEPALIAVAGRPVSDPRVLLDQIQARGVRDMGDGALCGRDQNDLDVCAVRRYQTAVFVEGLRSQSPEELVQAARTLLDGTR